MARTASPDQLTKPVGTITRGTTGVNRLRRSDRWLTHDELVAGRLRAADDPLVVDLGYGASPWTTLELATRLRAIPDLCRLRLVAVTGYGQESDRRKSREAGFDRHLVKPVDFTAVESVLAEWNRAVDGESIE